VRRLVLAALAAMTLVIPTASPSSAAPGQPPPAPTTVPPPPPAPPPTTVLSPPPPTTVPSTPAAPSPVPTFPPASATDEKPPTGESLIPDAGADEYPTGNYDIGYDEGAWNSFGRKALGFFTGLGWTLNRITVAITLWLVAWAFGFDIVGPLQGPILTIAGALNTQLAGPLQLSHFIWFAVIAYAGFQFFRGRAMSGLGEFLLSFAALAITMVISANPAGYLEGGTNTLRQTSGAALSLSRGETPSDDPSNAAQIVDPLRASLHDVLIEEPHEIINWGHPLTGACHDTARRLVGEGPWGAGDEPRNRMDDAGCPAESDFNHDPTFERLASAWMAFVVSAIVTALLGFAVVTMLIASLFFVLRFSWIHLALLGFQAPGAARELAWGWLVGMFKDLATVAGMSFVISYYMLAASAFLTAPGMTLAERFAILIVTALAMFLYRRRILAGVSHLTERLRAEAASFRPGSHAGRAPLAGYGGGVGGGASSAGMSGYGVGQRAREAVMDAPGSTAYEAAHTGRKLRMRPPRPPRHASRR
jgi:hypothetical protein